MSDEQKMPEVIYAGILDASEMSSPFNSSDKPYLRCPDNIDPKKAIVASEDLCKRLCDIDRERDSRIATLTAERDALVEAVLDHGHADGCTLLESAGGTCDCFYALAQLKETSNE